MKKWMMLLIAGAAFLTAIPAFSTPPAYGYGRHARTKHMLQTQPRHSFQERINFKDENGDGICDFWQIRSQQRTEIRDHDRDGIPNGRDADFQRGFVD